MRFTSVALLGFWLIGIDSAFAQGLPEGTYASTAQGCTKLQSKTAAELGEQLDFYVLTNKGVISYGQACDFVSVTAHNATSWIATAFCQESGYTYPDVFAVVRKDEHSLTVTRLTDLTQQPSPDTSSSENGDTGQGGGGELGGESSGGGENEANTGTEQAPYIRCENVKP
jgi:uncharacterized membrane protein YgcG